MTCIRTILAIVATACISGSALAQSQGIQLTAGIDGGVVYQNDPRFLPETGITVEAWITYDDSTIPIGGYYWPTIARMNINPNQESWNLRVQAGNNNNRVLAFIIRATNNALYAANYNFQPGELAGWTHVAGTFDGQTISIYKDGVLVATSTIPASSRIVNNGGDLRVGNGDPVAPGNEAWNGVIDELRIWPMARSAAEITATMQQQLWFMPGGVVEFDYNGTYNEFSLNLTGTPFGTIAFAPGAPNLTILAPNTPVIGQPTSTCAETSEMTIGSLPEIGNAAFMLHSVRGPTPASSSLGVLVAAFALAPAAQPAFFGVDLAFDISSVIATIPLIPPSNVLGNSSFNLSIPNDPGLAGVTMLFQFGFEDQVCGPQGFSAGSGLSVMFQ